jgi:glycosyltransferase involved in cell wall biosynthesis
MRNGKAVLVSNRGGLPEQVIDGFNGYVFALEEPGALTKLLERLTKPELSKLGANAKQVWRSSFNEQRTYSSLQQLYRRVMLGDDVSEIAAP